MNLKRKNRLFTASEALQSLFHIGPPALAQKGTLWKLMNKWSSLMGPHLGKQSLPILYEKGVLIIWVNHSCLMQEMIFASPQIKKKINQFLEKSWVKKVRFTANKKGVENFQKIDPQLQAILFPKNTKHKI